METYCRSFDLDGNIVLINALDVYPGLIHLLQTSQSIMQNKKKNAVKVCSVKPGQEPIMYEEPDKKPKKKEQELIPARLFAR